MCWCPSLALFELLASYKISMLLLNLQANHGRALEIDHPFILLTTEENAYFKKCLKIKLNMVHILHCALFTFWNWKRSCKYGTKAHDVTHTMFDGVFEKTRLFVYNFEIGKLGPQLFLIWNFFTMLFCNFFPISGQNKELICSWKVFIITVYLCLVPMVKIFLRKKLDIAAQFFFKIWKPASNFWPIVSTTAYCIYILDNISMMYRCLRLKKNMMKFYFKKRYEWRVCLFRISCMKIALQIY